MIFVNLRNIQFFALNAFFHIALTILLPISLLSQTVLKIKPGPNKSKDVFIKTFPASLNQSKRETLMANWGTSGGTPYIGRSLFAFDLNQIPTGATIDSIKLSLFGNPNTSLGVHTWSAGPNTALLQRITTSWSESGVSWSNMPSTTSVNEVVLSTSTTSQQDYLDIDVTNIVMDMINNPNNSHGFMFRLQTETGYRGMVFASSDCPDSTLWPELNIYLRCTVTPPLQYVEYCPGEGVTFKGVYYDTPTYIEDTVKTIGNCDSINKYLIREKVIVLDSIQTISNSLFYAGGANSFQWIDCETNSPIPNANSAIFKPGTKGLYSVALEIDGCYDTTGCFPFDPTGIEMISKVDVLQVYPNPFTDKLILKSNFTGQTFNFHLYDLRGKIVQSGSCREFINTSSLSQGTYFLHLRNSTENFFFKLTKTE